jgi:hypothetical protein
MELVRECSRQGDRQRKGGRGKGSQRREWWIGRDFICDALSSLSYPRLKSAVGICYVILVFFTQFSYELTQFFLSRWIGWIWGIRAVGVSAKLSTSHLLGVMSPMKLLPKKWHLASALTGTFLPWLSFPHHGFCFLSPSHIQFQSGPVCTHKRAYFTWKEFLSKQDSVPFKGCQPLTT